MAEFDLLLKVRSFKVCRYHTSLRCFHVYTGVLWIQLFSSFFTIWIHSSVNCFAILTLEWCSWDSALHQQPDRDRRVSISPSFQGKLQAVDSFQP